MDKMNMCAFKKSIDDLKSLKTKMRNTPYHLNLLSDEERLNAFHEAIIEKAKGIVFDIGAGCGILSILASFYCDTVYSVEIDPVYAEFAKSNFKPFDNIILINEDAKGVVFPDKADLIICEMLDTALIEEEQVPVINTILKFLKKEGNIIPCKILNGAEAIDLDRDIICYEDIDSNQEPNYELMSDLVIYNEIIFQNQIEEDLEVFIEFKILKAGAVSGIKITTFTLLTEGIICGPTPMLNPPLLIPTEKIKVDIGDVIKIKLNYKMGGGLDSIRTRVDIVS
ncbi:MAG: 50S ribosomal protein L11 methyltransferase [Methanobacterium sp.]